MKWLFFITLPLLAMIKVTLQSYFSKEKTKTVADSIKFNAFMFTFSALTLIILTVRQIPYSQTIIYALIMSIITVAYQTFYVLAFRSGPVSLSTTIVNFSLIFPVVFSAIFYQETITTYKIIGFILFSISICLMPSNKNKKEKSKLGIRTPKIWFILIIIAALFAGAINIFQQFFSKSAVANQSAEFTALTYVFSAILSFAIYPIIKGKQPIYKNNKKTILGLFLIGLALGIYNYLVILALTFIPATEYFPTVSGLSTLFTVIVTSITFKEFPSIKQIIGIAATIGAAIIVNIA